MKKEFFKSNERVGKIYDLRGRKEEKDLLFFSLPTSPNEAEFRLFLAGFGIDRPQPGNIDNFIFFVRKKIPGMELLAVPFQIETFIPISGNGLGHIYFRGFFPPPGVPSSTKRSRGDKEQLHFIVNFLRGTT